jgi:hypothetical protein
MRYQEPNDEEVLNQIFSEAVEDHLSNQMPLGEEEVLDLEGCGCLPCC